MRSASNIRPEEQLLSAVISMAIDDVCLPPTRDKKDNVAMSHNAYTAYRFLFEHGDVYLELLNINPSNFRKKLFAQLSDLNTNRPFETSNRPNDLIGRKKRMFKMNCKLYQQKNFREVDDSEDL
jgi:hypothetical protein